MNLPSVSVCGENDLLRGEVTGDTCHLFLHLIMLCGIKGFPPPSRCDDTDLFCNTNVMVTLFLCFLPVPILFSLTNQTSASPIQLLRMFLRPTIRSTVRPIEQDFPLTSRARTEHHLHHSKKPIISVGWERFRRELWPLERADPTTTRA